jgi:uncharacterized protein (TIGR03437 family)
MLSEPRIMNESNGWPFILRSIGVLSVVIATQICVTTLAAQTPSPWTVAQKQKVAALSSAVPAALSPAGAIYTIGTPIGGSYPFPPTRTYGDTSTFVVYLSQLDLAGEALYTTAIGGVVTASLIFDSASNIYVFGQAHGSGFPVTPGAYNPNAAGAVSNFVCKVHSTDGTLLYCTYLDRGSLDFTAVDGNGDFIFTGTHFTDNSPLLPTPGAVNQGGGVAIGKLNPAGTALVYAAAFGPGQPSAIAADTSGNVYVTGTAAAGFPVTQNAAVTAVPPNNTNGSSFTAVINPSGTDFVYSTFGNASEQPVALTLTESNEAQILFHNPAGALYLRRYVKDGSSIEFETSLNIVYAPLSGPEMAIDTNGVTTLLGIAYGISIPLIQPVQPCQIPDVSGNQYFQKPVNEQNTFLIRADSVGNLVQSTWLPVSGPLHVSAASGIILSTVLTSHSAIPASEIDLVTLAPPATESQISLACLGNSATFTVASLAPGEIVTLTGIGIGPATPAAAGLGADQRFPSSLSNAEVTFNGTPGTLLYVSSNQINAIAPYSLSPGTSTQVCVVYMKKQSNCIAAPVLAASPGVFMLTPASGPYTFGYAAALNQDGTVNTSQNPAADSSIVTIFVSGLGAITPAPVDGSLNSNPAATQNLVVQVQYVNQTFASPSPLAARIEYAGPAPLEVAGLSQINFVLPPHRTPPNFFNVLMVLPDGTIATSQPFFIYSTQ